MNEMNLNWEDVQLFLAVARSGGLAGATHLTGKSAPTLGRRMRALEISTGRDLFHRHARGYELTEEGVMFLNKAVDLEARVSGLTTSTHAGGQVTVKVSAGSWMTHVLCMKAAQILRDEETIRLQFISAEHVLDITHREAVIGIRNQRPEQIGLAAQRIGEVQFAGYAVSKNIKKWVQVTNKTPSARWLAENRDADVAIEVNTPRVALDLAVSGIARVVLPTFIGDPDNKLMRVTNPIEELKHHQWLVTHQEERHRPEVRTVINRIREVINQLHTLRV